MATLVVLLLYMFNNPLKSERRLPPLGKLNTPKAPEIRVPLRR